MVAVAIVAGVVLGTGGATDARQGGSSESARGGPVTGLVEIGVPIVAKRPTSAAYPGRAVTAAAHAPVSEVRNVIVYLQDAPTRPQAPVNAEIRQINESFTPRVVAVPVGSSVQFPNTDPYYHNVFSVSGAKNFNLGRFPQGKSKSVTFDKPGLILRKPGPLTALEFEQIKRHPTLGARILRQVPFLSPHLAIVELHHESPDGRGYPFGLRRDEITLEARIVHVADAFDAMTSARAYRPARPASLALAELQLHTGTQFDVDVVRALHNAMPSAAALSELQFEEMLVRGA